MQRSVDRILTTHAGSLPRPASFVQAILGGGRPSEGEVAAAVRDVVRRQAETRIDVVSDGEMSKTGFHTYVGDRLSGFGGRSPWPQWADIADFPDYAEKLTRPRAEVPRPRCEGPIGVKDPDAVQRDVVNLRTALDGVDVVEAFVPAVSPGVIAHGLANDFYPTHEEYLFALADALAYEYRAITDAGFLLQVDCPDLAMIRHGPFADAPLEDFRRAIELDVDALNQALHGIPPDRVRVHVCWGNYPGPHHRDVPLRDIVDVVLRVRAGAVYVEGANPRHAHEWTVWEDVALPDDRVLIVGVIDTVTNHVEHPELVAERLVRLARIVGRERVIGATDCGFGTYAGVDTVHPSIAWAKLRALVEGAEIATARTAAGS
jgi:5-methyltetrahydropteroyltriglutamate--homocysteine methyltransferase